MIGAITAQDAVEITKELRRRGFRLTCEYVPEERTLRLIGPLSEIDRLASFFPEVSAFQREARAFVDRALEADKANERRTIH